MNAAKILRLRSVVLASVAIVPLAFSHTAAATDHNHACADSIQSKIAWNAAGDKFWKDENLTKLCAGTKQPSQPGECFKRVMNEHLSWGVNDAWKWENAVNLCAGTDNAEERIGCFKGRIATKVAWQEAIYDCQRSGKPTS